MMENIQFCNIKKHKKNDIPPSFDENKNIFLKSELDVTIGQIYLEFNRDKGIGIKVAGVGNIRATSAKVLAIMMLIKQNNSLLSLNLIVPPLIGPPPPCLILECPSNNSTKNNNLNYHFFLLFCFIYFF